MGNSSSIPTGNPTTTNYESYYPDNQPDSPRTQAALNWGRVEPEDDPVDSKLPLYGAVVLNEPPSWSIEHTTKLTPSEVDRGRLPEKMDLRHYPVVCSSDQHVESFDTFYAGEPGLTPGHTGVILKDGHQAKLLESVPGSSRDGKVKASNWGRRDGWIASPTEPVKEELWKGKAKEENEREAMAHFKNNYEGKPYNYSMVNEGKGDSYQCAEFSREFLNSQLSDDARQRGADVAAPRDLTFDETWQQNFFRRHNSGNAPPTDKTGISPGDTLARGHFEIKGFVKASMPKCTPDRPCPPWRRPR